jgi:eukaryotic-like serine/threonine-protein kinase
VGTDGTRLALGTKYGGIQVWNTRNKTLLLSTAQRFGEVYALAWSLDGKYLASGGQDQSVHQWNTATGQQGFAYHSRFSTGEVLALAWSPDGTYLAEDLNVGIGQVWDTTAHTLVAAFSNFSGEDEITALAWMNPTCNLLP